MNALTKRFTAFRAWFLGLEQARRMWFLAIAGLGVAGLVVAFEVATYVPMVPLFDSHIDPATTRDVIAHLDQQEVSYTIERGTDRVFVPDASRDQLRMELMGGGTVSGKNIGLELFEENRFGSTKFVEHIRYVRGLQGEIERQINGFDSVRSSKVLLSLPEQSLFEEDVVEPSASVYLELKSGTVLSYGEGARIATLVANAVPRLGAEGVAIMDEGMRVIHASSTADGDTKAASSLSALKRDYERYYKREIEDILERVVGPGKVVARVNVILDNAQRSLDERKLHPDQAVAISTDTSETTETGATRAQGTPGTTANIVEDRIANEGGAGSGGESSTLREIGNFDVPHTWRSEASLPGGIQSLTAAVLVDGVWNEVVAVGSAGAEPGATPSREYVARTEEELASYSALVAGALGVGATAVTMVNQPFATVDLPDVPTSRRLAFGPNSAMQSYMRYGFALLVLALTFGFIVRPVMKNLVPPEEPETETDPSQLGAGTAGALPAPGDREAQALAELIERIGSGAEYITREEVSRLVSSDLTHSLVTLQTWLAED